MAFARWDPIRDLLAIQQRLDRFAAGSPGWTPPVDLHETTDSYTIVAELPGLGTDDVRIDFADGCITLSGARRESGGTCEAYHRIERGHGSFSRSFPLPVPIDGQRITADLRDGILTVICPKLPEGAARRVQIS